MNRREEAECLAFMQWSELVTYDGVPLSTRIVHVPNERDKGGFRIVKLLQLGLRKGFPDYAILIPTPDHHGLYIEAKAQGAKPSREQVEWMMMLRQWGYCAEVCVGFGEMTATVRRYLARATGVFNDRVRFSDRRQPRGLE